MVSDVSPPDPTAAPPALRQARAVARALDDLIRVPGTRYRVGLDPLLGLVPGLGDWVGWAASGHLLVTAVRLRAPAPVVARMAANALLDAVVGAVPVVGDLWDVGWKANRRNLRLLERHVAQPAPTARTSRFLVGAIVAATFALMAGAAVGAVLLFRWVAGVLL
jgi:hypothetical protein